MIAGRLPAVTCIVLTYQGAEGDKEMVQRVNFDRRRGNERLLTVIETVLELGPSITQCGVSR